MMNRGKGANSDNTDHISFMGMNGGVLSLFVLLICDVLSAEFFFVALGCVCPLLLVIGGVFSLVVAECIKCGRKMDRFWNSADLISQCWKGGIAYALLLFTFFVTCELANQADGRWTTPVILTTGPLVLLPMNLFHPSGSEMSKPVTSILLILFICSIAAVFEDMASATPFGLGMVVLSSVSEAACLLFLDIFIQSTKKKVEPLAIMVAGSSLLFILPVLFYWKIGNPSLEEEEEEEPSFPPLFSNIPALLFLCLFGAFFTLTIRTLINVIRRFHSPLASTSLSITAFPLILTTFLFSIRFSLPSTTPPSSEFVPPIVLPLSLVFGFASYVIFLLFRFVDERRKDHVARCGLAESHTSEFRIVEIDEDDFAEANEGNTDPDELFKI